jgi:hypothetical protein
MFLPWYIGLLSLSAVLCSPLISQISLIYQIKSPAAELDINASDQLSISSFLIMCPCHQPTQNDVQTSARKNLIVPCRYIRWGFQYSLIWTVAPCWEWFPKNYFIHCTLQIQLFHVFNSASANEKPARGSLKSAVERYNIDKSWNCGTQAQLNAKRLCRFNSFVQYLLCSKKIDVKRYCCYTRLLKLHQR